MQARIPQETKDKIVEAYQTGLTYREATEPFGCDQSICGNELRKRGITPRTMGESRLLRIPKEHRDEMVKLYLEGNTQRESVAKYGHAKSVLKSELIRRGIEIRPDPNFSTQTQRDEMVEDYLNGVNASDAAAKHGFSSIVCYRELKGRGLTRCFGESRLLHINKEDRDEMVNRYEAGLTLTEAVNGFNASLTTLQREINRRGKSVRSKSEAIRKYHVNDYFFKTIDTEEKAYWLGFISADGNVYRTRLDFGLAIEDRGHLIKLRNALDSNHLIEECIVKNRKINGYTINESRTARYHVDNKSITNDLRSLGVMPNKSLTIKPCTQVPSHLLHHYWRGVFEGDGCICKIKSQWIVYLCGNEYMVKGFASFLKERGNPSNAKLDRRNKIYRVQYMGIALPQLIVKILYNDATRYLERKKHLADELLSTKYSSKKHQPTPTEGELLNLLEEHGTWKQVADVLGICNTSLWRIRKRLGGAVIEDT